MCRWVALLSTLLLVSLAIGQEPLPSQLVVLDKVFDEIPVLWQPKEPYAPVGDWLTALQLRWATADNGLAIEMPQNRTFLWTTTTTCITFNGQAKEVAVSPLLSHSNTLWLPLVSLARALGLTVVVNEEKRTVKLATSLQGVELLPTQMGWLISLTFTYPLPSSPKVGTLRQPDRCYVDLPGAALGEMPVQNLPEQSFLKGVRFGQFSNEPLIVRFVADVAAPAALQIAGRTQSSDGQEQWHFLLQPDPPRADWLGQVRCVVNSPKRAILRFYGWWAKEPAVQQEALVLKVSLPQPPLLPLEVVEDSDGLVERMAIESTENGCQLIITLRRPANFTKQSDGEGWLLVLESPSARMRSRLIVVDAGHGGKDPGAMSPLRPNQPQLIEKHLTLEIAFRLKELLEQSGYRVLMTRTNDTYLSLSERVAIANNANADAFVSIHLNAFPQPGAQWGVEVYYWTPQSYPLAERIYRHLLSLLERKGNGIRQRQLYVVRHTTMPAVLVEPCYLNHPEEEALLREEWFRQRIAMAIYRGILEFFGDWELLQQRGE